MKRSALLIAAISIFPGSLYAQEYGQLESGKRIRLSAPTLGLENTVGTLVSLDSQVLVMSRIEARMRQGRKVMDTSLVRVPMAQVARLQVSLGRRSNIDHGAKRGLLIGSGIGLALGIAWAADNTGFLTCDAGCVLVNVLGGASTGAALGAGIGALSSRDIWQDVPVRSSVVIVPLTQRVGIGVAIPL